MKHIIVIIIVYFLCSLLNGQTLDQYAGVDKFKIGKTSVKVFFNDLILNLYRGNSHFDQIKNAQKFKLVSEYLHHNPLYVFVVKNKRMGIEKVYILRGDPSKQRTKYYFHLDIVNGYVEEIRDKEEYTVENTIEKIRVGGVLFEHMYFFQTPEGKKMVGKSIKFWDYFTTIEPYENVKKEVSRMIELDLLDSLPEEILLKPKEILSGKFGYQECGLDIVKEREMEITIFRYDSVGGIYDSHTRLEKDYDLYVSSTSKEITGVTSFPYFSRNDTMLEVSKDSSVSIFRIDPSEDYIRHYLEDILVYTSVQSGAVEKITGKLIIHGYSQLGHSTSYELYVAYFEEINGCQLPSRIQFHPLSDTDLKRPRYVNKITYLTD